LSINKLHLVLPTILLHLYTEKKSIKATISQHGLPSKICKRTFKPSLEQIGSRTAVAESEHYHRFTLSDHPYNMRWFEEA
jgi:hypothetical protein